MRLPGRPPFALVIALVAGPFLVDCGISEDELVCEDAVSLLASCCPGLAPRFLRCPGEGESCGCGGVCTPAPTVTFTLAETRCIGALDCAAIRSRGICERAASRVAVGSREVVCE